MTNDVLALEEQLVPTTSWQRRFIFFRREMKPVDVHLDFDINGMPLRTWIQEWEGEDTPPGEVSLRMADRPDLAVQQIERLLGLRPPPVLEPGLSPVLQSVLGRRMRRSNRGHPEGEPKGVLVAHRLGCLV